MSVVLKFDEEKNQINLAKHGLPLDFAALLFEGDYKEIIDARQDYGETRMIAIGPIAGRLCVCVYAWRLGARRVISLRKANGRKIDAYHKN